MATCRAFPLAFHDVNNTRLTASFCRQSTIVPSLYATTVYYPSLAHLESPSLRSQPTQIVAVFPPLHPELASRDFKTP